MIKSHEAEQAVLGALLLNSGRMAEVAQIIEPGDFASELHRAIFETMLELSEAKQSLDVITISGHCEKQDWFISSGGIPYLIELSDATPSSANIGAYADIVKDRALRRRLVGIGHNIQQYASDFGIDGSEAAAKAYADLSGVNKEQQSGVLDANEACKLAVMDLTAKPGTMTSVFFDEESNNLEPGLYTLAGSTGAGKSMLAYQIAMRNCEKHHVLIQTMEMPAKQVANRMACAMGAVPFSEVRKRTLRGDDYHRYSMAMARLKQSNMHVAADTPTVSKLCARARAMKAQNKLDLLIVDYLQLLAVDGKKSRHEAIGEASRALKQLSIELDIPVIQLSQLSREHEKRTVDRKPRNSDLRESGAIEQDSDMIVFLYDESKYSQEKTGSTLVEFYSGKVRHGEAFHKMLSNHEMKYCRFTHYDPQKFDERLYQ